jgi:hypothetical protein
MSGEYRLTFFREDNGSGWRDVQPVLRDADSDHSGTVYAFKNLGQAASDGVPVHQELADHLKCDAFGS